MAMIICPECKRWISETASSCPGCGYQLTPDKIAEIKENTANTEKAISEKQNNAYVKQKRISYGCLTILMFFVVLITIIIYTSYSEKSNENNLKPFKEGEIVKVGNISYKVLKSSWRNRLYLYDESEKPNAMFLLVGLVVRNNDIAARNIPPLYLIDQSGRLYEASNVAIGIKGTITVMDTLNPNVEKRGGIIFDVPKDNIYFLQVSDGYVTNEKAYIELSPKNEKTK